MSCEYEARRYARFFETLKPQTPKEAYAAVFESDIYFEDPFHRCKGIDAAVAVFTRMFDTVNAPAFCVDEIICRDAVAYLRWEFSYRDAPGGTPQFFEGVSRVQFADSGRASSHIDYWDAARNVYERLPMLGWLLSGLRRRIGAE